MAEDRGNWLLSAALIFCVWSGLMFLVRVWAKLHVKRWGTDDYAVLAAFIVSIIELGSVFWAVQHGYGVPLQSIQESGRDQIAKALFMSQQSYVLSGGLCKVSASLFLIHLAYPGPQVKPGYGLVGLSAVWTVTCMLVIALRGDLGNPWSTLDGSSAMHVRWIAVEVTGLLIEITIWGLSISLVRSLQINWQKRAIILCAFGVRLLLIPIVAARLYYLASSYNTDPTYTSIVPHIATEAALHFSVVSASITSLRPFLRSFHQDYTIDSKSASKHSVRSGDNSRRRESYYRLETLTKAGVQAGTVVVAQGGNLSDEQSMGYPAAAHQQGRETTSQDELVPTARGDWEQMQRAAMPGRMGIQKTVNWSVQYEETRP